MSLTTSEMTPADIAALTGNRNNGGFGDGFGNGWWIILLFLFGFWGGGFNNGFGRNGGGSTGGAIDGYVLTSDFANIERKLDGVNNGLCDGFYAMNTSLLNGFASVNQNMSNGFQTAELSRANQQAALMQQLNAMQMQAANCCCETREAIQGVNYNLATPFKTLHATSSTTRTAIAGLSWISSRLPKCRIFRRKTSGFSLPLRSRRRTAILSRSSVRAQFRRTRCRTRSAAISIRHAAVTAKNLIK